MAGLENGWHRFLSHAENSTFDSRFATAFAGRNVCVTGAGGDIGSALTKSLRPQDLGSLVLVDAAEHGLFEMQRYMETKHPHARCYYILGSVEDYQLLASAFDRVRPEVVFHAAGVKHVGLTEHNPVAAVRNNVLGTHALLRAASDYGASIFVMLSTDKAVRPHSVMGVSKRIGELLTVSLSHAKFRASAIRLGNVIGSRGSVIPLFLRQIAQGLPISVTDRQASRYFFSRHEAINAILAAGAAACDGVILVPPFLRPVLVAELAEFLARQYDPSNTPRLHFTGLRPGEKLTEDLVGENEEQVGTVDGPLTVTKTRRLSLEASDEAVARFTASLHSNSDLVAEFRRVVPEYAPSELMRSNSATSLPGKYCERK